MTTGEFWFLFHLAVGVAFVHGSVGGITTLLERSFPGLSDPRLRHVIRVWSTVLMAVAVWLAAITGTWLVYPGYRAEAPAGAALAAYPKQWLLARGDLAWWHNFGMEWKEHIGWLAPFLASAVAFSVTRYRTLVTEDGEVRQLLMRVFAIATVAAVVAAGLGAAVNAIAPNDFLDR